MINVQEQTKNNILFAHIVSEIWSESFYQTAVICLTMGESVSRVPIVELHKIVE